MMKFLRFFTLSFLPITRIPLPQFIFVGFNINRSLYLFISLSYFHLLYAYGNIYVIGHISYYSPSLLYYLDTCLHIAALSPKLFIPTEWLTFWNSFIVFNYAIFIGLFHWKFGFLPLLSTLKPPARIAIFMQTAVRSARYVIFTFYFTIWSSW